MEQAVVAYLRQRGLLEEAQMIEASLGAAEAKDAAAEDYAGQYRRLHDWVTQSLDLYQTELAAALFPVWSHCVLELGQRGRKEEAEALLDTYSNDFRAQHEEELQGLRMEKSDFQRRARSERFQLTMSNAVLALLTDFLRSQSLYLLTALVNDRLRIHVENRPPAQAPSRAYFPSEADPGAGSGRSGDGGASLGAVEWGALPPPELFRLRKERERVVVEFRRAQGRLEELRKSNPDLNTDLSAPTPDGGVGTSFGTNPAAQRLRETMEVLKALKARAKALEKAMRDQPDVPWTDGPIPDFATDYGKAMIERLIFRALNPPDRPLRAGDDPSSLADTHTPTCAFATLLNAGGGGGAICAAISPGGLKVAAAFGDSSVRVWHTDGAEGKEEEQLIGHSSSVHSISWHPSQRFALSAGADGDVRLWDTKKEATARALCVYPTLRHTPVHSVQWNPAGHFFMSAGRDTTVRLWVTDRVCPVRLLVGHRSDVTTVAWHPNLNYVLSGSFDKTLRLWDVRSHTGAARIFTGHFTPVLCSAVSPNGQYVVGGGGDGRVRVWDVRTAKEVSLLAPEGKCFAFPSNGKNGVSSPAASAALNSAVYALSFSADGLALASGGGDCAIRIYDAAPDTFGAGDARSPTPPLSTVHTKASTILALSYTERNLLLGVGAFSAERAGL